MKKLQSRQRILSVRETQLRIATGESASARGTETGLQEKRRQLHVLAGQMHSAGNQCGEGRSLHAQMELAQRLRSAGEQMERAIENARQNSARAERQRIAAYQDRQIAEKLTSRAARDWENELDRRAATRPQPMRRKIKDLQS